jgi:hypothetical protein
MGRNATLKKQRKAEVVQGTEKKLLLFDLIQAAALPPNEVASHFMLSEWIQGRGLDHASRNKITEAIGEASLLGEGAFKRFIRLAGVLGAVAYSTGSDPVLLALDPEEALGHLVWLTQAPELQDNLLRYGQRETNRPFSLIHGLIDAGHRVCRSHVQAWQRHPRLLDIADQIKAFSHLDCHLDAAADIAAGRCVHDAGQLVLHRRRRDEDDNDCQELCLSFRSADGCLSFFPRKGERLQSEAVRSMRAFVSSYRGETLSGTISPHPMAARVCRLAGLRLDGGRGVLEGQP